MSRRRILTMLPLFLIAVFAIAACENYDLEVRNKTDEVLDIYVDEYYEGSLAPKNYLIIRDLSHGEHYIEAFNLDEDLIAVDDIYIDGDSKWIIYDTYYRLY
ncbi:hypothetical protein GF312_17965 [Candidatus Poribacteria bacterium]|nr:hypothetical protein [Candidatus Poribacteria bacterium]